MGENAVKRRTAKLLMEMFLNTLRLSIFYDIIRQTISFSLQELVADEISVFMCLCAEWYPKTRDSHLAFFIVLFLLLVLFIIITINNNFV